MQFRGSNLLLAVMLARSAVSQEIDFFYTEILDTCEIHGSSMSANEQTTHGGVCAYRQDVDRIYACPAPDPMCWTWADDCTSSGVGQTICNRGGTVFCCNAVAGETCTTTEGQINVCISNFTSPNSGIDVDTANANYLRAINEGNVTATSQTVDPTPFSTLNLASTSATSSTSLSASTDILTTSVTSRGPDSPTDSATTSNSSSNTQVSEDKSGLSGGAIAGIVIGALAVLALIGGAFFLLGRRRKQRDAPSSDHKVVSSETHSLAQEFETKDAQKYQASPTATSELDHQGTTRVEMPASYPASANGRTQLPQELA